MEACQPISAQRPLTPPPPTTDHPTSTDIRASQCGLSVLPKDTKSESLTHHSLGHWTAHFTFWVTVAQTKGFLWIESFFQIQK